MSSPAKQLFENQARIKDDSIKLIEQSVFLHVLLGIEEFLVPLTDVSEVAEYQPVKPYPLKILGHCGIIHLRGSVIPVVAKICGCKDEIEKSMLKKIVVLRTAEGDRFAILATQVRKVSIPKSEVEMGDTITLHGNPVHALSADQFMKAIEALK